MRRVLNVVLLVLLVLAVVVGAFAGYLATSNPVPRKLSEGWVRVKSLPSARGEMAMAVVEARSGGPALCARQPCGERLVYVLGGMGGPLGRTLDSTWVFDPPSNAWREGPKLPEGRHHLAAAGLGDTLYVTGGSGKSSSFAPHANVWVLRPGRISFERLAQMPEARTAHSMVAVKGKLYVVGGMGQTTRVLVFDPALGWKLGAPMPERRDHAAVVAVQTKIYVIGGRGEKLSSRVDVYDTVTDSWEEGPALPDPNSAMSAAVLSDGLIHVVGGEEPKALGGKVMDLHLVLDPVAKVWLEGPKPILPVHGTPGVNVQGKLLVIGGSRRQGVFSVLGWSGLSQVFDPALLAQDQTPSPTSRPTPSPASTLP